MKKNNVAVIAIAAVLVVSLAAAAILLSSSIPAQSGQLAIVGTDPPIAASGVTKATIHYSSVAAHASGSDMASGWAQVSGSGTMELTLASGTAQTLASSRVAAGTYDAFRLNIDSATTTFNGQEYVATVASTTVTAQSQTRVKVNTSSTAAAVVDLRTFIINAGNASRPQFILSASAAATSVPQTTSVSISINVGVKADLSGEAWFTFFQASSSTHATLFSTLSSGSLSLSVMNSGTADAEVQEVIVTPVSSSAAFTTSMPASFSGSAFLNVGTSGSMQASSTLQATAFLNSGTRIASGSSTDLSFLGNLAMNVVLGSVHITGVVAGQQYLVTVIGANTYASTVLVAA